MCGIFGVITSDSSKIDMRAVAILGIINETRGTTSCGLAYDGEIHVGINTDSKFRNFIPNHVASIPETNYVFGHTRNASAGMAVSEANAHPFGFGENPKDRGYAFMGAHNGTLYNHLDLAKQFEVETEVEVEGKTMKYNRTMIDSEVLLNIIYKTGSFEVLKHYNGAAALVMVDTVKNKVYFYSGKSRRTEHVVEMIEERPLHVYEEGSDILYFSSEADPLFAIGGIDQIDKINQIEYNTVYEFTPGKFSEAVKHTIDRSEMTQTKKYVYASNRLPQGTIDFNNDYEDRYGYGRVRNNSAISQTTQTTSKVGNSFTINSDGVIEYLLSDIENKQNWALDHADEKYLCKKLPKPTEINPTSTHQPFNDSDWNGTAYESNFRYKCKINDKTLTTMLDGIYIHISGFGFYKVGDNHYDANQFTMLNKSKYLDLRTGLIVSLSEIPTPTSLSSLYRPLAYIGNTYSYFYKGYLLADALDFNAIKQNPLLVESSKGRLNTEALSHMCFFPVFDAINNRFLKNGTLFTGTVANHKLAFIHVIEKGLITRVMCQTGLTTLAVASALRSLKIVEKLTVSGEQFQDLRVNIISESKLLKLDSEKEQPIIDVEVEEIESEEGDSWKEFRELLLSVLGAYEHYLAKEEIDDTCIMSFYHSVEKMFDASSCDFDIFKIDLKTYIQKKTNTPEEVVVYDILLKLLNNYK